MDLRAREERSRTFTESSSASSFTALLLIFVVLMMHVADRVRLPSRTIKVLLVVMVAVLVLLYVAGTFGLMADIAGIVGSSKTSLRSSAGIAKFCRNVQELATTRLPQVIVLITVLYLFLQALCIPGTLALNAVAGALLGTPIGVPYCTLLGTAGASCCYMLSSLLGVRMVEQMDMRMMKGKGLPKVRMQVNRYRDDLLVYLLFLRLTPILPNWLVNLASPVVGVPLRVFALATFIGVIPQTYLSVRFGALAHGSADGDRRIVTPWDTLLLAVLGIALLAAALLRKRFSAVSPAPLSL